MPTISDRIYSHALFDLGLAEVPGVKSNPRIELAIKTAASWLDRDDSKTAWCGCIRGLWGLETGTGVPKEHYRAASWLEWGEPVKLSECRRGDTIIFTRPGGNHVALVSDYAPGSLNIKVLGGNQSNAVTIASYAVSSIRGIRR